VITAYDGEEGLKRAKQELPHIILLDLIMPVMDGFDVLEQIKANPDLKHIPVLILSNLGQDSDINKAKELGAVDYLVKANWSLQGVIDKIKSHLQA